MRESKVTEKKRIKNKVEQGIANNKNDINAMKRTQRDKIQERD
jgi:hypothetical protein